MGSGLCVLLDINILTGIFAHAGFWMKPISNWLNWTYCLHLIFCFGLAHPINIGSVWEGTHSGCLLLVIGMEWHWNGSCEQMRKLTDDGIPSGLTYIVSGLGADWLMQGRCLALMSEIRWHIWSASMDIFVSRSEVLEAYECKLTRGHDQSVQP